MSKIRRLTAEQAQAVAEAYVGGATIDQLALRFGVSASPIRRCLIERGVPIRRRGHRTTLHCDGAELVRRYHAGASKLQLARELNVNVKEIHRRLLVEGVTVDSRRRRSAPS